MRIIRSRVRPLALPLAFVLAFLGAASPDKSDQAQLPISSNTLPSTDPKMEKVLQARLGSDEAKKQAFRDTMDEVTLQVQAEDKLAEENHRLMVRPAPPNFKSLAAKRKVSLKLFLEKSKIHIGEKVRFRLELTNIGSEPILYREYESSLFKYGGLLYSYHTISFYLVDSSGHHKKLTGGLVSRSLINPSFRESPLTPPPSSLSKAEKDRWILETNAESAANAGFKVRLAPGETLFSLGDMDSAQEPYRTLFIKERFNQAGKYRLQVELDDRPKPLTKKDIDNARTYWTPAEKKHFYAKRLREALGPISSNAVSFEVAP